MDYFDESSVLINKILKSASESIHSDWDFFKIEVTNKALPEDASVLDIKFNYSKNNIVTIAEFPSESCIDIFKLIKITTNEKGKVRSLILSMESLGKFDVKFEYFK